MEEEGSCWCERVWTRDPVHLGSHIRTQHLLYTHSERFAVLREALAAARERLAAVVRERLAVVWEARE